jgi:hypothetical protein
MYPSPRRSALARSAAVGGEDAELAGRGGEDRELFVGGVLAVDGFALDVGVATGPVDETEAVGLDGAAAAAKFEGVLSSIARSAAVG